MNLLKGILQTSTVTADDSSIAIGGDNFAPLTLNTGNTGLGNDQFTEIQKSIQGLKDTLLDSSETKIRDEIDEILNNQIDSYVKFIENNRPRTALQQFEDLLKKVKGKASGKIRFRLKANIGICHYILGDENKAADYLLEAYEEQPSEPKAVSNKVLALILKRKSAEAYEFGKQELISNPENESLAGYLVQASRLLPQITDPLSDIPKSLRGKPEILIGQIHYLQHRAKEGKWWKFAHEGLKKHPNDNVLKQYAAQAVAEEILSSPNVSKSFAISDKQFIKLTEATKVLLEIWDQRCKGEGPLREEDLFLGINLINIFYFLSNQSAVSKVLSEAIDKSQDKPKYLQNLAQYAIQFRELELAERAIEDIRGLDGSEFINFAIAQAKGDSEYLSQVSDAEIQKFPISEQKAYKIISELSKFSVGKKSPSQQDLEVLLKIAGTGIRELLLISHAARSYQLSDFSKTIYQKAIKKLTSSTHISCKCMLAREAIYRKDWPTVIECLDGSISTNYDSEELRYLATAYANEIPVMQRAVLFFRELIYKKINTPNLNTLYGVTLYNQGALIEAINILTYEIEIHPQDLYAFICLINSYIRIDNQIKIKELVSTINPYDLEGDPIHKMHLAQLLVKYDRAVLAYEFGYSVLSLNPNSDKVVSMYLGLILMGSSDNLIPTSNVVSKGYCVQLQNKTGIIFEFLLDDNPVAHMPVGDPNHPLIKSSLGLSLNSEFEQIRDSFPSIKWQITEIKHKYLHALHLNLNTFETKFPESKAIFKIDLPEDENIDAILKSVKIQSEKEEDTLKKYVHHKFPLAIMAPILGRGHITITTAERLINAKYKIHTNLGSEEELITAIQTLENHDFHTVVLDTYTAWHAALLDILPTLKKLFTKIVISQSVIDDINSLLSDAGSFFENESMSIGWKDGEFQRYVMTLEENHKREDYIKTQRAKILEFCDIELVALDEPPNELVSGVIKIAGIRFWEPAILANQPNRLLLSEDVFYRQWASQGIHLDTSTWTEPVLRYALKKNIISLEDLTKHLIHFSQCNHMHIFLNRDVLLKSLEIDKSEELYMFGSLCKYIGDKETDLGSDILFAKMILEQIWASDSINDVGKSKSTDHVLHNLLRYVSKKALLIIALCQNAPEAMADSIIDWREKNGIDDEQISQAHIELLQYYGSKDL